jgi:hypothetical protein
LDISLTFSASVVFCPSVKPPRSSLSAYFMILSKFLMSLWKLEDIYPELG